MINIKNIKIGYIPAVIIAIVAIVIICFVSVIFGIVSLDALPANYIGAALGSLIGALITLVLLRGQTDIEEKKNKDVEIYKEKIKVFSRITGDLWKMIDDVNSPEITKKIASEKAEEFFKKFKTICFNELVFYFNQSEIKELTETIKKIDINNLSAKKEIDNIGKITYILQNSLENKGEDTAQQLKALYSLFDDKLGTINKEDQKLQERSITINNEVANAIPTITYWHFNMWDDAQIEAFKNNNWILSLFECEEDWRTNLLLQVKKGDVIFLFRRGGYGYIGAFKAEDTKALCKDEWNKLIEENKLEENKKYNIYNAFNVSEATVVSNIIVRPIAYNYEGVGYLTVRRRTIERMYDDEAIKYLLKGFNGIFDNEELKNYFGDRSQGKGKLDSGCEIKDLDSEYFSKLLTEFGL